jgi:uncharacterized protein YndB with AHSA1/START domain
MAQCAVMGEKVRGYAHRVDIDADAATVWRALTEQPQLARWCCPDATLSPRQGGLFRARVDRVTELEAHIDAFEPGRRLRLIYLPNPQLPPAASVITDDFMLDPVPAGTILRLLGSGVPATPEWDTQYVRLRTSWMQALNRLKILLEARPGRGGQS